MNDKTNQELLPEKGGTTMETQAAKETPKSGATTQQKVAAAKAAAKEKAGEKKKITIDTINPRKTSATGIMLAVLERAGKPLTAKELVARATKSGSVKQSRAEFLVKWFHTNKLTTEEDGKYTIVPKKKAEPAKA